MLTDPMSSPILSSFRQGGQPAVLLRAVILGCFSILAATQLNAQDGRNSSDYRIAARDELKFQVTGELDEPLVERVSTAGEISIPLLGAVNVAGLSLREAEALMEKHYREGGFFIKPQVILSFNSYAPRSVSVLGQVNNPSTVDFSLERERMGIVNAITKAGGFTRVARPDSVKVTRNVDGKDTTFTINVTSYLDQTSKDSEFKLMPDDIVFVPERVF